VIREATADDFPLVRELFLEFQRELEDVPFRDDDTEEDLGKIEKGIGKNIVLIAERDGEPLGLAVAEKAGKLVGYLGSLYVRPSARTSGVAAELVREVVARLAAQGVEMLELDVLAKNTEARAVYERWGSRPCSTTSPPRSPSSSGG